MATTGAADAATRTKAIHYSVSGEPQETTDHKLRGREILARAGFTPADDYRLTGR